MATARLIVSIGQEQQEFSIEPGAPCRIGRSPHNTIELPDESVSRAHATVQVTDSGSCYLYDLDSRNGTLVNGRRVSAPTVLRHGDHITIGLYHLNFIHEEASSLPAAGAPPATADTLVSDVLQQVTIAVVDIRDYAGLARRVGETRLAEIMAAFHRDAGAVFEDMGAWTQKYLDAAVMAAWVHRSIKPPFSVVLSAFESVAKLARVAAGLQARFGLETPVRISAGLETGKASIHGLDSRSASDLAALGDAVDRAFRMDSGAKDLDCEIAFGSATGEILLQGVVLAEHAQQRNVALRGAAEPTPLWIMSLASLSKMLGVLPQRTVRIQLP